MEKVGVVKIKNFKYPKGSFNPPEFFEEFKNFKLYKMDLDVNNKVYKQVRDLFIYLGLDVENIGKNSWNPLKTIVKKGDKVVVKPNLVLDKHPLGSKGVDSMITHASVIRPIIDYMLLATDGDCKITICDVPLQSASWEGLIKKTGLKDLVEFYENFGVKIDILDLRYEIAIANSEGIYYKRIKKIRDPLGYVSVNLGKKSYIQDIIHDYKKLEITDYGRGTVSKHHNPEKNEYLVPKTILNSDVFINVPKMKTHKKAGVTLSMKNLIGINGDKSWIAHHRKGVDEYKEFKFSQYFKWYVAHYMKIYAPIFLTSLLYKLNRKVFLKGKTIKEHSMEHGASCMEGNWYGNDTVWRTILDLNNVVFFSDKKGRITKKNTRRYFSIIDGIVGMEGEGPMDGKPKDCGVLIGGFHPVAVDYIASYMMGFDYLKIPSISEGFQEKFFGLINFKKEDILVNGNVEHKKVNLKFEPCIGWKGKIER